MKYLLIDTNNLFHRIKNITKAGSLEDRIGLTFHIIFNSILNCNKKFEIDYPIFFFDSKSWRKYFYEKYKQNRKIKELSKTQKEKEEDEKFMQSFNDFFEFLDKKTNAIVLKECGFETDDLISFWIDNFKNDFHIILSTDKDYIQLLDDNVILYNGVDDKIFSTFVYKTKQKTKIEIIENTEWELFKKIIRGDSSDNIFSVYPGIRETKLKIIFEDMKNEGYEWTNFMLSKITNIDGEEKTIKDLYNYNKILIDLKSQPQEIKELGVSYIKEKLKESKNINNVGIYFLKFAKKYGLEKLSREPEEICKILNKKLVYSQC
ncbi:MAG: hypothetical protein NZZ41_02060 [Candidatus Dojkabacteria bacterium]|nr:hypothetical protein [Candidatus Dojkabacteria bacterium]